MNMITYEQSNGRVQKQIKCFTAKGRKSKCDIKDLVSQQLSDTVKVDVKMRCATIFASWL